MWVDQYQVNTDTTRTLEGISMDSDLALQDPMAEVYERVSYKSQYRSEETGFYHPLLNHGLKLRNNGGVDLFTDQDTGFRIDPNSQSINAFANDYKLHIHAMTAWLTGSAAHYVDENWTVKTKGKHIMISDDNIEITTNKNQVITIAGDNSITVSGNVTVNVDGNLNAKVKQHATIDVSEIDVNADNVTFNASKKFVVNSPSVPWK